jgi:large conductance mechanosensitive channel
MSSTLDFIGAIIIIITIIVGIMSGSFLIFLFVVAIGIVTAIIFFALAKVLENQENILYILDKQEKAIKKSNGEEKVVCPKCNYAHDDDYTSCPHCGYRY